MHTDITQFDKCLKEKCGQSSGESNFLPGESIHLCITEGVGKAWFIGSSQDFKSCTGERG